MIKANVDIGVRRISVAFDIWGEGERWGELNFLKLPAPPCVQIGKIRYNKNDINNEI